MERYEVTAAIGVRAGSPGDAEALVSEALAEAGVDVMGISSKASPVPEGPVPMFPVECLTDFGVDPQAALPGERIECLIMQEDDEDSREARVTPARGLLCVRWHTTAFGSVGPQDEAMETGQFCGGTWRRDAGYKAFYYARKG